MKVISIREPWASLIVHGYKEYEFRTWKTNYRGPLYIHASKVIERNKCSKFTSYHLDYQPGKIIGVGELVDCIKVTDELEQALVHKDPIVYQKSEHPRVYAWHIKNVQIYDGPMIKGKLGIWNF